MSDDPRVVDACRMPAETCRALEEAFVWVHSLPLSPQQSTSNLTMSSKRRRWRRCPRDTRSSTKASLSATIRFQRKPAQLIVGPGWKMGEEGGKRSAAADTTNGETGLAYQPNIFCVKAHHFAKTVIACQVAVDEASSKLPVIARR